MVFDQPTVPAWQAGRLTLIPIQRKRTSTFAVIGAGLWSWFRQAAQPGYPPERAPANGESAGLRVEKLKVDGFKANVGWLNRSKSRHRIILKIVSEEEKSVNTSHADLWQRTILQDVSRY